MCHASNLDTGTGMPHPAGRRSVVRVNPTGQRVDLRWELPRSRFVHVFTSAYSVNAVSLLAQSTMVDTAGFPAGTYGVTTGGRRRRGSDASPQATWIERKT
ncbi:hypothetical protein GCM10023322_03730 [Rugosimonospora acidiphila]|uniref:Uncharacterized protein n=1 Tax=Rugosimonospora acidiphila TaxID=556531 RepID=A0ABP9RIC6_9ACTN